MSIQDNLRRNIDIPTITALFAATRRLVGRPGFRGRLSEDGSRSTSSSPTKLCPGSCSRGVLPMRSTEVLSGAYPRRWWPREKRLNPRESKRTDHEEAVYARSPTLQSLCIFRHVELTTAKLHDVYARGTAQRHGFVRDLGRQDVFQIAKRRTPNLW